jgi:hypothetical protein
VKRVKQALKSLCSFLQLTHPTCIIGPFALSLQAWIQTTTLKEWEVMLSLALSKGIRVCEVFERGRWGREGGLMPETPFIIHRVDSPHWPESLQLLPGLKPSSRSCSHSTLSLPHYPGIAVQSHVHPFTHTLNPSLLLCPFLVNFKVGCFIVNSQVNDRVQYTGSYQSGLVEGGF